MGEKAVLIDVARFEELVKNEQKLMNVIHVLQANNDNYIATEKVWIAIGTGKGD